MSPAATADDLAQERTRRTRRRHRHGRGYRRRDGHVLHERRGRQRHQRGVLWLVCAAALPRCARLRARISMDVSPATASNGQMTVQSFVRSDRSRWLLKIFVEVAFISIGVFLALMGEQWRERAHARELARGSLQRFRVEIVRNRKSIDAVKDYHKSVLASLQQYMDADAAQRDRLQVRVRGLQPATLEHTAWDLALASQSLADIDPNLAFELSRIYGLQTRYDDVTRQHPPGDLHPSRRREPGGALLLLRRRRHLGHGAAEDVPGHPPANRSRTAQSLTAVHFSSRRRTEKVARIGRGRECGRVECS